MLWWTASAILSIPAKLQYPLPLPKIMKNLMDVMKSDIGRVIIKNWPNANF